MRTSNLLLKIVSYKSFPYTLPDNSSMYRRKKCAAIIIIEHLSKIKRKRLWCKEWYKKRSQFTHLNLLNELRVSSTSDLRNYLRMDDCQFKFLLKLIEPQIKKQNTVMRDAISTEERLTVTLRFIATGRSYEDLKYSCAISPQSLRIIIPETCSAIYLALKDKYFKFPKYEMDWIEIARDFQQSWNFPNCCGAIDGKHVKIVPPPGSGSYFYNYKGTHSIVMMAIANANYEFIMVHVGTNGRISDGGVIGNTRFYKKLTANELNIPANKPLPGSIDMTPMPYVFVADDAFVLSKNIMKPFSKSNLSKDERIFNYRLSRARRVIENAFGILSARFRIFHTAINLKPDTIEDIVLAACVLHNFLRRNSRHTYTPHQSLDIENTETGTILEGEWRTSDELTPLQMNHNRHYSRDAKEVRDYIKSYFVNEGKVLWQDMMI